MCSKVEKNTNIYAPIIIPTLCRFAHFKECIESLQANTWAKYTDLYISLDYPVKNSHIDGNKKIKKYLKKGIIGFNNVYVFYQSQNLGAYLNERFLINEVYKSYNYYIYTEDDNVFAPSCIEYLDKGLKEFEQREEIIAICAHSKRRFINKQKENVFCLSSFSAYGFATWKSKEQEYERLISKEYFAQVAINKEKRSILFNSTLSTLQSFSNIILKKEQVHYSLDGEVVCTDLAISLYMLCEKKYAVYPRCLLARNMGYDGTGENCIKSKVDFKMDLYRGVGFNYKYLQSIPKIEEFTVKENLKIKIQKLIYKLEILLFIMFGRNWYKIIKNIKNKNGRNK